MPSATTLSRSPPRSHPRAIATGKSPSKIPIAYPRYESAGTSPPYNYAASPPASSAVPSLISDNSSSADNGMSDVDLLDMLDLKLSHSVRTEPLDRGMARQAQASGTLNAKQRELAELQQLAQRRLKTAKHNFADGAKAAKEVRRDLEWTQKKVSSLKSKSERKYPEQYRKVHSRYD